MTWKYSYEVLRYAEQNLNIYSAKRMLTQVDKCYDLLSNKICEVIYIKIIISINR